MSAGGGVKELDFVNLFSLDIDTQRPLLEHHIEQPYIKQQNVLFWIK